MTAAGFAWKKAGLFIPPHFDHPLAGRRVAIPFAHPLGGDRFRVYFSGRDPELRSRIFHVDVDVARHDGSEIRDAKLSLDIGELGAFDDAGVMPSWVVDDGKGGLIMYYTGWSLGKTVPFYFYIGAARSTDGGLTFQRLSRAPVLGRTKIDPFLTASACVLREPSGWRMWYVSGARWEKTGDDIKHYYNLRHARSADGLSWTSDERPAVDFTSAEEYALGRPCVVAVDGGYLMWFATRGDAYRLALASSRDGLTWTRHDPGIAPSAEGWDSQMIEYAHVFRGTRGWKMLYNGNGYGETGAGLATADELPDYFRTGAR